MPANSIANKQKNKFTLLLFLLSNNHASGVLKIGWHHVKYPYHSTQLLDNSLTVPQIWLNFKLLVFIGNN